MIALVPVKETWSYEYNCFVQKHKQTKPSTDYVHNSWDVFYTHIIRLQGINAWNLFETKGSALITWV